MYFHLGWAQGFGSDGSLDVSLGAEVDFADTPAMETAMPGSGNEGIVRDAGLLGEFG